MAVKSWAEPEKVHTLMKLSDAVALEGYQLVVGDLNRLTPQDGSLKPLGNARGRVTVCEGHVVVCPDHSWDYAYGASHEIAEHRYGFEHSAQTFAEQANILARWLKQACR